MEFRRVLFRAVLDNPDLPAERLHFFVERTHHQAQRLRALLQDISTLNKLDESRNLYERSECDVVRIVNEVLSDFHVEIEQKGVTIDNRLTGALELRGNRTLLYSIFHNLIDNALNYAGEGITIEIDLISKVGGYYALSVSDNGVGIDQEHVSRIFERFYRVDKGRSRKLGGTGLGLSIVKNGVLFHHGTIKAQSQLGEGVEFIFTLRKF